MCYGYMIHNYDHVVKTEVDEVSNVNETVYLYCTQCGDVMEVGAEE